MVPAVSSQAHVQTASFASFILVFICGGPLSSIRIPTEPPCIGAGGVLGPPPIQETPFGKIWCVFSITITIIQS